MAEYKYFATVYDRMMDNIPYDDWEQYILLLLYKNGVKPDAKITEIGCGTGTMTRRFAEYGLKMTGIDVSLDMLKEAKAKSADITYIHMDMREMNLPEKQDVIFSTGDSVNYILTNSDLKKLMKSAYDNLADGGVFLFDLKTDYFFRYSLDGYTYREDLGDFSYVWKNIYDEENHIHSYYLKFRHGDNKERVEYEIHKQRAFFASDIKQAAVYAGFDRAKVYGEMTLMKPKKKCERFYILLKK